MTAVRSAVIGVACAAVGSALAFGAPSTPAAVREAPTPLRVGDVVRVGGTDVECAVVRRAGRPAFECVKVGRRAGTYGVQLRRQSVAVFRFEREAVAQTVFRAEHGKRRFTVCARG